MKTLYIIRHAKSSWDDSSLDDFDRPLNQRGFRDAPFMAKFLKSKEIIPDLILSSPANRAYTTAKVFMEELDVEKIILDKRLYLASSSEIFEVIGEADEKMNILFLFGHNPGLTTFVNSISNKKIDELPTCGIAGVQFNLNSWKDIKGAAGKLFFFEFPKKHFK